MVFKKQFDHPDKLSIDINNIKNATKLWNSVKLYRLKEDNERFETILLIIKASVFLTERG